MGLLKPPCGGEAADEHWHPNDQQPESQILPKAFAKFVGSDAARRKIPLFAIKVKAKAKGRRLTEKNVDEVDSE